MAVAYSQYGIITRGKSADNKHAKLQFNIGSINNDLCGIRIANYLIYGSGTKTNPNYNIITWSAYSPDAFDISNAQHSIELSFKMQCETMDRSASQNIVSCLESDSLFEIGFNSVTQMEVRLQSADGTNQYTFPRFEFGRWSWKTVRMLIDKDNSKFKLYLNDTLQIDSSIDLTKITAQSYRPGFGTAKNSTSTFLTSENQFDMRAFSFKVDDVELWERY